MRKFCDIVDIVKLESYIGELAEECGCVTSGKISFKQINSFTVKSKGPHSYLVEGSKAHLDIIQRLVNFVLKWQSNGYYPADNCFGFGVTPESVSHTMEFRRNSGIYDASIMVNAEEFRVFFGVSYLKERDIVLKGGEWIYTRKHAKTPDGKYLDLWNIARDVQDVILLVKEHYGLDWLITEGDKSLRIRYPQHWLGLQCEWDFKQFSNDKDEAIKRAKDFSEQWSNWLETHASLKSGYAQYHRYNYLIGTMVNPSDYRLLGIEDYSQLNLYVGIHPSLW